MQIDELYALARQNPAIAALAQRSKAPEISAWAINLSCTEETLTEKLALLLKKCPSPPTSFRIWPTGENNYMLSMWP